MPPDAKNPEGGIDPSEAALIALMRGYLDGRLDAFDGLYDAFAGRLRGYLMSLCRDAAVADDLLQETFLQMHRSRRTYEPGRPVTPWVFAIARHVFLMHRRSAGRRLRFEERFAADLRASDSVRDDAAIVAEQDAVRRALAEVPADQRETLLLHHVGGWSFAEIAARLGIRSTPRRRARSAG